MLRVGEITRSRGSDTFELAAIVDGLPGPPSARRLWFKYPRQIESWVTDRAEPFLAALLPLAMRRREALAVDGPVSERLLSSIDQIMTIWGGWFRGMQAVEVKVEKTVKDSFSPEGLACFFTGGVDSSYTALKNLESVPEGGRITHLVYVDGFDVPLDQGELSAEVVKRLRAQATGLGLELVVVTSNLRHLFGGMTPWEVIHHGPSLAAVGLSLSPYFRSFRISASDMYSSLSPAASHPMVDPLWSTESTEFIHDGCEASRVQKIERYVGRSQEILDHLRVCLCNAGGSLNCGTCEKCVRTMICLRAGGALERCPTFSAPLDLDRVRKLSATDMPMTEYLPDVLEELKRTGRDPELAEAIREGLSRLPAPWLALRSWVYRLDRRHFGGALRNRYLAAIDPSRQTRWKPL